MAKVVADTIRCRSGHYRAVTAKDVRDAMERCGMRPVGAGRAAAWHRDTYGDGRPWTW